jgi:hypothetical protein
MNTWRSSLQKCRNDANHGILRPPEWAAPRWRLLVGDIHRGLRASRSGPVVNRPGFFRKLWTAQAAAVAVMIMPRPVLVATAAVGNLPTRV